MKPAEGAGVSAAGVSANHAAPWIAGQRDVLLRQRGHARLLQGPSGLGQFDLALEMVRAWLCERPAKIDPVPDVPGDQQTQAPGPACGNCPSCHAIDVFAHADLFLLAPETFLLAQGWPLSEDAQKKIDNKERKPSKEIRVEAMRDCIEFCQRTNARGRGKAVLVYPAERMNGVTANALLKSLEEPPGDVKFVLATESAHQLLPTIRSRCVSHTMVWPSNEQSFAWLVDHGLDEAQARRLLKASGQRPQDALDWLQAGHDMASWSGFPKAMQRGDVGAVKDWGVVELLKSLHKLCHDLMVHKVGGEPRYFNPDELPGMAQASLQRLVQWSRELTQALRTAEHPYSVGLMQEALVSQARLAMAAPAGQANARRSSLSSIG